MPEFWDAYDDAMNPVPGVTLVRGKPIPDGLYHLVCDVIVRHADGTYLLMRRDPRKQTHAGRWELTAGGSAMRGEDAPTAALRELFEETGIRPDHLTYLGQERGSGYPCFHRIFLCETAMDKNAVVLQDGETDAFRWADLNEITAMPPDELISRRNLRFLEREYGK